MIKLSIFIGAGLAFLVAASGLPAGAAESLPEDQPVVGAPLAASSYGRYLAGRHAEIENDAATAADLMSSVLASDPDNRELAHRAFLLALAAGRVPEAEALAERIHAYDPTAQMVALTLAVDLIRQGKNDEAVGLLGGLPGGGADAVLLPLIKAWVAAGTGDLAGALETIAPLENLKGLGAFHAMHAGMMQDLAGRAVDAEASYEAALDEASDPSLRMHEIVANFYLRQGRAADARAVYDRYAAATGAPDQVETLIAVIDEPGPLAASVGGVAAGIAESLFGIATLVSQDNIGERASMYAHLALSLRPDLAIARMLIAEIMASQGRDEDAIAAYRRVPPDSLFGWQARREAAEALTRLGRVEETVAELQSMIEAKPRLSDAAVSLGNVLRAEKRFVEAATAYDTAIARLGNVTAEHWLLFYYRGIARERAKQWETAEKDFLRALELQPDQPHALNYLAYSWVEQGRDFDKALEMLRKAVDQRPDDGYIVDSLGWVYQRLGQYDKAVELLERAIELKPQDPVINDHLGDAYWRVGRKLEARFQWRRALFFEPEPDQVAPIEGKIEAGLADGPSDG